MMRKPKFSRRRAFSLLEVMVALAMLALISVPALGLVTMVLSRSKGQMTSGTASELKARVDTALRATNGVLDGTLTIDADGLLFAANEDISVIALDETSSAGPNKYFRILVKDAEGFPFTVGDSSRMLVYEVTWPYQPNGTERNQLFFTSVFRK